MALPSGAALPQPRACFQSTFRSNSEVRAVVHSHRQTTAHPASAMRSTVPSELPPDNIWQFHIRSMKCLGPMRSQILRAARIHLNLKKRHSQPPPCGNSTATNADQSMTALPNARNVDTNNSGFRACRPHRPPFRPNRKWALKSVTHSIGTCYRVARTLHRRRFL